MQTVKRGRYFEEFTVGERFVTQGRTVTETDIVAFAALTGDYDPLHVDAEFGKKTQFGERCPWAPRCLVCGWPDHSAGPDRADRHRHSGHDLGLQRPDQDRRYHPCRSNCEVGPRDEKGGSRYRRVRVEAGQPARGGGSEGGADPSGVPQAKRSIVPSSELQVQGGGRRLHRTMGSLVTMVDLVT